MAGPRFLVTSIVLAAGASTLTLACGGDDDSGGMPDARVFLDAAPDAPPAGLSGLGQSCSQENPCPTNAPVCIQLGLPGGGTTNAFCTAICLENGTGMTNAQGQFAAGSITPAPNDAPCAAAFTGTVGTPACAVITSTTPMHNPLMANTQYTQIAAGCAIVCGAGNACPNGTTCTGGLCTPS
jgi:hypothetical protein